MNQIQAEAAPVIKPIGEIFLEQGLLDESALARGLRIQAERGERLGLILSRLGLISEAALAKALSIQLGIPFVEREAFPRAVVDVNGCPLNFLKAAKVLPLARSEAGLALAMADPRDRFTIDALAARMGQAVLPHVAAECEITAALEKLYDGTRSSVSSIVTDLGAVSLGELDADIDRLRDLASEQPIIRLVNHVLNQALERRASDVHLEPFEHKLLVRYRIDGMLHEIDSLPAQLAPAVISRIKIMARLDIAERRLPQDGRIQFRANDRQLDLRVSLTPSLYGESVVLRILKRESVILEFSALGLAPAPEEALTAALGQHHGILLVTGPTGSGKTTTLYTALQHLNSPERKIITVEDPVEYELPGVIQIQVNPKIDLTFARVLRSIVRQNPNIIMIGEMRDLETAEIAVRSALTGHLVLSTLHTNDAPSAITRLLDMGVENFLLNSTVNAVLAQRLVRTLCTACREAYRAPAEIVERFDLASRTGAREILLYRAPGCEACAHSGYVGRIGIFEILPIDDDLRQLVLQRSDASVIQRYAHESGMVTMFEDGLHKALAGRTTIEEVRGVTRET